MRLPIVIDRGSALALHRQIYEAWRQGILAGRFRRGTRLPSTRELAAALAVSRTTTTAAYDQLIAEGYLEALHGSGTYVCRDLPEAPRRAGRVAASAPAELPVRLSRFGGRLAGAVARRAEAAAGVINLSTFGPDFEQFPFALWRRMVTRHLRHATRAVFDRAGHGAGYEPLRHEIAVYVARSRAIVCSPEQVIVVNGSQQALDLCVRLLVDPDDEVAIENPGYPGARELVVAHGARVRPIRVTADGIAVRDLEDSARLVYVTPSHQFPTGVSMSLTRRLELIAWARPRGAVIIEDDYDSEYRYSGAPLPAMQSLANGVPVIYVGTFSNVMFPGLRIGYVVVPRGLVASFTRAKWLADRHTTLLEQAALADFIREGHLDRHIRRMRRVYKARRTVLVDSLARYLGKQATIDGGAAGMHLLVRFRSPDIGARAARNRVRIASAAEFYMSAAPANAFVLGFSAIGERTIREGVKRLAP
jgi:GntR family transcriptional regulator/MocR family aminotransferase